MAVLLKGFDKNFKKADEMLGKFDSRMFLEGTKPTVWTKQQVEDLKLLAAAMSSLWEAISEMANQVRDD